DHRHGVAVEVAVGWQILRDDLAPFAEAYEDVLPDGNVALEKIGHGGRGGAQHFPRPWSRSVRRRRRWPARTGRGTWHRKRRNGNCVPGSLNRSSSARRGRRTYGPR